MSHSPNKRDGRWSRYPETILKFDTNPEIDVDLRQPVEAPVRDGLRAIGLDGKFAVVTAYNPQGQTISAGRNDTRSRELEAELQSAGEKFVRVDACSPDELHCECSVALAATQERAVEIARHFDQIAIFWFDGDDFWIVGVLSDAKPMRLPRDA